MRTMLSSIIWYFFKNSILFTMNIVFVMVVQNTVFKRHCFLVKVLWILSILHAFLPFGIFNIQLKRKQVNVIGRMVSENSVTRSKLSLALACIWLAGVIIIIAREIFRSVAFKKLIRKSMYLADEKIYMTRYIDGAVTYGILRPKIVVSYLLDLDTRDYVVRHEREHIIHRDNFLKFCYMMVAIINWYNPLVWLGKKNLDRVVELCCDRYVVLDFSSKQKSEYLKCLFMLAVGDIMEPMTASGFISMKSELYNRMESVQDKHIVTGIRYVLLNLAMIASVLVLLVGIQQGVEHVNIVVVDDSELVRDDVRYPHGKRDNNKKCAYMEFDTYTVILSNYKDDEVLFYDDKGQISATSIYTNK